MSGRPSLTVFCLAGCLSLGVSFGGAAGCASAVPLDGEGDGDPVPFIPPDENGGSASLQIGAQARVMADFLNMRDTAGTSGQILVAMPCGAWVKVLAGPSEEPTAGWWNVEYSGPNAAKHVGWASGKYLMAATTFDKSTCGVAPPDDMAVGADMAGTTPPDLAGMLPTVDMAKPPVVPTQADAIFDRAKLGVGYSYWWGHGAWRSDGVNRGTCTGSCPSCSHTGSYGADCSGFISKVWQIPSASALSVDQHPYSTFNFYNEQTHWKQISRGAVKPADAMVRRVSGSGHIALVESAGDPYGSIWMYEARACAAGIVHNARTLDSSYRTIRKNGL